MFTYAHSEAKHMCMKFRRGCVLVLKSQSHNWSMLFSIESTCSKPYSSDLQWRMVHQRCKLGLPYRKIGELFKGTVHRTVKLFEEAGTVCSLQGYHEIPTKKLYFWWDGYDADDSRVPIYVSPSGANLYSQQELVLAQQPSASSSVHHQKFPRQN